MHVRGVFGWQVTFLIVPRKATLLNHYVYMSRFVLEHISGVGTNTMLAEFVVSRWTGKGTFTIRHAEHELPTHVILATGLTMEAIRHKCNKGSSSGGYTGS